MMLAALASHLEDFDSYLDGGLRPPIPLESNGRPSLGRPFPFRAGVRV